MNTLDKARKEAERLIEDGRVAWRSCHECNGAHKHFKDYEDFVINCFECGKWWLGAVDVTIYDDEEES